MYLSDIKMKSFAKSDRLTLLNMILILTSLESIWKKKQKRPFKSRIHPLYYIKPHNTVNIGCLKKKTVAVICTAKNTRFFFFYVPCLGTKDIGVFLTRRAGTLP